MLIYWINNVSSMLCIALSRLLKIVGMIIRAFLGLLLFGEHGWIRFKLGCLIFGSIGWLLGRELGVGEVGSTFSSSNVLPI